MNNPASNFGATPAGGVCIGGDPTCPCQDGDVCHYVDDPVTETAAMVDPQLPTDPDPYRQFLIDLDNQLSGAIRKLQHVRRLVQRELGWTEIGDDKETDHV